MTAREQEPQQVGRLVRLVGELLVEQGHGLTFLVGPPGLTPDPIERLVAGCRREPGSGVVGYVVVVPAGVGNDDRFLESVLGYADVAGQPDEGGQHLATLSAEDLVEGHSPSSNSIRGRTSTRPPHAPGIWAAQWIASSRSLQSRR